MVNRSTLAIGLLMAVSAWGQLRPGMGGGGHGHGGGAAAGRIHFPAGRPSMPGLGPGAGFGSVVNPSGIPQMFGVVNPVFSPNTSFGQRLGATVTGSDWAVGAYHRQAWRGGIVPYPVFVGGYGATYQAPAPNVTVVNAPAPSVFINNSYAPERMTPSVTEVGPNTPETLTTYTAPVTRNEEGRPLSESMRPPSNADGKPTVYLVAMRSGEVYTAVAFWLEEGTFHYITPNHVHNRASVELVDTGLSRQLNEERGLEFKLAR